MSDSLIKTKYSFLFEKKTYNAKLHKDVWSHVFVVGTKIDDFFDRGKELYGIFDYTTKLWTQDWNKTIELIDEAGYEAVEAHVGKHIMDDPEYAPIVLRMANTDNNLIDKFNKFVHSALGDNWKPLNQNVLFSDSVLKKEDYATGTLPYPLKECPTPAYDKLMSRIYGEIETEKIEWYVGAIIQGDQKKIQKILVFYGQPGSGKSTIISRLIVDILFGGEHGLYCAQFSPEELAERGQFATAFLAKDPVVAFQDDADLSRIETNVLLNTVISHEPTKVNDKFQRTFIVKPNCLCFVGTNDPVQLTPRSGLYRRLIDVRPTGDLLSPDEYDEVMAHLPFEASGIAYKCLQTYKRLGKNHYNKYTPENMLSMTNPFHNFVKDRYFFLRDGVSLPAAYKEYQSYCDECAFTYVLKRYQFRDQLKLYFDKYDDSLDKDGKAKNYFSGFKVEKIGIVPKELVKEEPKYTTWLNFNCTESLFDELFKEQPAQYPLESGALQSKWKNCTTKLKDLDTHKVHHVKVPTDLIVFDFDLKDDQGNKSFEKNVEAASKFPQTYAELSKSEAGVHLHYWYRGGDPSELSRVLSDNIEVKVFTGDASLRRKLSKCNDLPIAEMYSGLEKKDTVSKTPDWDGYKNQNVLKSMIIKNTEKFYHSSTKSSIDYINDLLNLAYNNNVSYDLRDLSKLVLEFGSKSTHNKDYCQRLVKEMKFVSDDKFMSEEVDMVNWNVYETEDYIKQKITEYISTASDNKDAIDKINSLLNNAYRSGSDYNVSDMKSSIVSLALGSDKSKYCLNVAAHMHFMSQSNEVKEYAQEEPNNHESEEYSRAPIVFWDIESNPGDEIDPALFLICWKYQGEENKVVRMYNPSPGEVEALFNYRLIGFNNRNYDNHMMYAAGQGYTPQELNKLSHRIIDGDKNAKFGPAYNLSYTDIYDFASANNKKSLKKWEIELGIHHQEAEFDWDKPVPQKYWEKMGNYCENDVKATEAVFNHLQPDFMAREILADLSGLTVNDTTNTHTTQILVGDIKDPQSQYIYTDLSTIFPGYEFSQFGINKDRYLPGVKIVSGKSIYKGIDPGEGGRKIGYPGMYTNVGLFDVASMHPSSAIRLQIFGPEITKRFENIVKARIAIKHKDYDTAIELLGEKVRKYLTGDPEVLKANAKNLANALKTAINSVYGLTSASFPNKLRDPKNIDNIVAKYGALFMIDLEEELTNMGYKVVHVSTDSIKVADVDDKVAEYIMSKGKEYGYTFEYEALYSKMCLVNDAVYIAKFATPEACQNKLGFVPEDNSDAYSQGKPWSATGAQFAVPYVYKTLFSHETIEFNDFCETFSVKEGAIYLDHNEGLEDPSVYEKELTKLKKKGEDPERVKELEDLISKCHKYEFIGRIGQFTPVLPNHNGGALVRIKEGKAYAVQGTKKPDGTAYHWLDSEVARALHDDSFVDRSYYTHLVDKAVETISQYGDFEVFISDDIIDDDFINPPQTDLDEVPFDEYIQMKDQGE